MPAPENAPKTLKDSVEEDRLEKWREKRAKVAEESRQERLRIAEAERRKRLEEFEADKARRIHEAAEKRAQSQAAERAKRMSLARSRIPGRTDLTAARKRLMEYRKRAARLFALRLTLLVCLPTALFALYQLNIATPFYVSTATFAIQTSSTEAQANNLSPFGSSALGRETQVLRQYLLSPGILNTLNNANGFQARLSADTIDPLNRMDGILAGRSDTARLSRYLNVSANAQDGIVTISAKAPDPALAQAFTMTVLQSAEDWLAGDAGVGATVETSPRIITPPTYPAQAALPSKGTSIALAFLAFLGLYAIGAIFVSTLQRHRYH